MKETISEKSPVNNLKTVYSCHGRLTGDRCLGMAPPKGGIFRNKGEPFPVKGLCVYIYRQQLPWLKLPLMKPLPTLGNMPFIF